MGNGAAQKTEATSAGSMQQQLESQLKKQVKSAKYPPFSEVEVQSLIKKFKFLDRQARGAITLEEFKELLEIRMHFFRDRIYTLIDQEMSSKNQVTMNFDQFMRYLQVFHPLADMELKQKYLFRIYDFDNSGNITEDDLVFVFNEIFMSSALTSRPFTKRPRVFSTNFMNEAFVKKLGKDVMNIVDTNQSKEIDFDEFLQILTDTDIQFRMNIVF